MKRFRKLLAVAGKVVGLLLLLVLAVIAEENLRGYLRLRRVLQQLHAQGEPLTLAELHLPQAPKEGNAAPALEQAAKELEALTKTNPIAGEGPHGLMALTEPGRATVASHAEVFPAGHAVGQRTKDGNPLAYGWPELERELANGEAPLARLRESLRQPLLVPEVDYKKSATGMSNMWKSFFWLVSASLDGLHTGSHDAATENIVALPALAGYMQENLHASMQMIAVTTDAITLNLIWEALQDEGWTNVQLGVLQAALIRSQSLEDMLHSLEYEQVHSRIYFEQLRQSNDARTTFLRLEGHDILNDLLGDKEPEYVSQWIVQLRSTLWWLLWADQDEARSLELWQRFLEAARLLRHEKSWATFVKRDPKSAQPLHGLALWQGSFSEALHPQNYRGVLEKVVQTETQRQMTLTAIALKRYALRNDRMPPSLEALVPALLPVVPTDLMDGKPLRYRPAEDGKNFLLYSVGLDGHDDGGNPTPAEDKAWRNSLWAGRDAVWPTVVTSPPASSAASP